MIARLVACQWSVSRVDSRHGDADSVGHLGHDRRRKLSRAYDRPVRPGSNRRNHFRPPVSRGGVKCLDPRRAQFTAPGRHPMGSFKSVRQTVCRVHPGTQHLESLMLGVKSALLEESRFARSAFWEFLPAGFRVALAAAPTLQESRGQDQEAPAVEGAC